MEPAEFETFDEAKQFIIDELGEQADCAHYDEDSERYNREVDYLVRPSIDGPFATPEMPDGYVYWVDAMEG
jgi:hypothetical protein